jgi:uncharacterized protein (DUF3084 family)
VRRDGSESSTQARLAVVPGRGGWVNAITELWGTVGIILVATIGALSTWLVTKRKASGSVVTSEAETLWSQSQEMRDELRNEVVALRKRIETVEAEAAAKQSEIITLHKDAVLMAAELAVAKNALVKRQAEVTKLNKQLQNARAAAKKLSAEVRQLQKESGSVRADVVAIRQEMGMMTPKKKSVR